MKRLTLSRHALTVGAISALLGGCVFRPNDVQPPTGASANAAAHRATSPSYRVVHKFGNARHNGRNPVGGLLDVNGMLYGTTQFGGGGACGYVGGCGTVYRLDPATGVKKVLYAFRGGSSDGVYPVGGLIDRNGTLYGATTYGGGGCGNYGCGTVYSISLTGTETMLHTFDDKSDAFNPFSGLVDVNGTLYGTTLYNSASGGCFVCGAVYSITTSGSEKVLYAFAGGNDGAGPEAPLINVKGTLYGTTFGGGKSGVGTVYTITTTGTEKVLYSFDNSPDGAEPTAGLIDVNGTLYGTTTTGGTTGCVNTGCGVVYSITTTGKEKVLYSFIPTNEGPYDPSAGLAAVQGVLYGTTAFGHYDDCGGYGCGIIYSLTTGGQERLLHAFLGGSDGAHPNAALIDVNGVLYGTTPNGGGSKCNALGCGTVFALSP